MALWPITVGQMAFFLVAGHFIGDFPLQGDAIAVQKSRHTDNALALAVPWYYWLSAHAVTHGTAVLLITSRVDLAVAETMAHGLIDFAQCERWINLHVDQGLHLLCKVLWLALAFGWIGNGHPL